MTKKQKTTLKRQITTKEIKKALQKRQNTTIKEIKTTTRRQTLQRDK